MNVPTIDIQQTGANIKALRKAAGIKVKDVADMLVSNSGLAYNSKLAYEILKTIRYATEKRDSSVLKVTNEPLPRAEGSFQIRAL